MDCSLKPFGVGESFGKGLSALLDNFPILYGIGLIGTGFTQGLGSLLNPFIARSASGDIGSILVMLVALIVNSCVVVLASSLASGFCCRFVASRFLGQKDSRAVLGDTLRRLPALIGASLLSFLVSIGGVLLLIVPGIIFALRLCFVGEVAVLEDLGPVASMRRSRALAKNHWGKIILLYLIVSAIGFAQTGVLALLKLFIPGDLAQTIGRILLGGFTMPLGAAAEVIYYLGIRVETESLDVEQLAASFPAEAAEAAGA
ncbi:MAG TPA: hypothetical protein P5133_10875 [Spirochaetia bacterium]|nr:hypothetical protein [Spirochaetia bacterium]HRZ65422.1 hypothetical protein [Spirochaetia bacterium]